MKNELSVTLKIDTPEWFNKMLNPIADSVGESIADLWKGLISGLSTWSGKRQIDKDSNLLRYKQSIENGLSNISPEHLQEADFSIVGLAMDTSKFFYQEEHYRMMFSKLISKSFDSSYKKEIHPAFVSIIQQLSPMDARILFFLAENRNELLRLKLKNVGIRTIPASEQFLNQDLDLLDLSLNNLKRLGLISFIDNNFKVNGKNIQTIQNSNFYEKYHNQIGNNQIQDEFLLTLSFTALGENFIKVCIY